jgi:hypothetical protein
MAIDHRRRSFPLGDCSNTRRKQASTVDEVETKWESIAEDCGLFGSRREFLIHVAGVGAAKHPWACVQRNSGLSLAHHLAPDAGGPEFVAMSIDGRMVCGVTTEEYDVWIVCKGFT